MFAKICLIVWVCSSVATLGFPRGEVVPHGEIVNLRDNLTDAAKTSFTNTLKFISPLKDTAHLNREDINTNLDDGKAKLIIGGLFKAPVDIFNVLANTTRGAIDKIANTTRGAIDKIVKPFPVNSRKRRSESGSDEPRNYFDTLKTEAIKTGETISSSFTKTRDSLLDKTKQVIENAEGNIKKLFQTSATHTAEDAMQGWQALFNPLTMTRNKAANRQRREESNLKEGHTNGMTGPLGVNMAPNDPFTKKLQRATYWIEFPQIDVV